MSSPLFRRPLFLPAALLLLSGCLSGDAPTVQAPEKPLAQSKPDTAAPRIDFNTHIRPILNQNCTACHGGVKSAGEISFVYRDVVDKVGKKSGNRVIVPGEPEASELIRRVTSTDKDYRMPPADHGPALPAEKIALLREWIKQGAPWQDHWAFVPPRPQVVPTVAGASTPIDAFIRAKVITAGLAPAPEAPRAELLRRVSLDLIGLPPTPSEVEGFAADGAPDAYEKQVERLLASPHFGERWASLWLDLARYADTKGYEADRDRTVWPFRDWVIDAFNRNVPYDQFVIEQLAGDLLPKATLPQRVATTFHRLTQVNDEGGTDDEEFRTVAVVDRVSTTWQVMNGVTFGCAQCHSHPYEPIRHEEYYRFLAFFNGTRDADFNDEQPTLRVPDNRARYAESLQLRREINTLRRDVVTAGKTLEADSRQWTPLAISAARATPEANISVRDGALLADGTIAASARYEVSIPIPTLSLAPITAVRFEVPPDDPETARHTPERGFIVNQLELTLSSPDGRVTPLEVGRFFPDTENFTTITTKTVPKSRQPEPFASAVGANSFATAAGGSEKSQINLLLPRESRPPKPVAAKKGAAAKSDAGLKSAATETRDITLDFHFAANPTLNRTRWIVAALREPIDAPAGSTLRVSVVHSRQITSKPATVRRLRVAASTDPRWNALARDPAIARKAARVTQAIAELGRIPGTDLPVMEELPSDDARETRRFHRGDFLTKTGPALTPGVPALFPPLPSGAPANRLTLARWFFQPGQPLTARVAVNRFWEQLFGTGIVATLEDFGSVGEPPSHPELLDWLALHFERDLRWDMKALLREIVTSATYRQDAHAAPELLEKDPKNRLLARGPRQRLTAEMVRDQALTAGGLLSQKMGGAPVMPPQPAGVWQSVYNNKDWVESKGEDRYRRAVYTFWKRSAAYPGFLTFDMPGRDFCTARRTPTNTPLQALVTLNDVVYQEAARALAARAQKEIAAGAESRIARMFELVVSREPTANEMKRLRRLHDDSLAATNDAGRALTDVGSAILNLDAAFVR